MDSPYEDRDSVLTELELAIIDCHLQDIAELRGRRKGKEREGAPIGDGQLAIELYEESLQTRKSDFHDRDMALSLWRATQTDSAIIAKFEMEEEQIRQDRDFAFQLQSNPDATPPSHTFIATTSIVTPSSSSTSSRSMSPFASGNVTPSRMQPIVNQGKSVPTRVIVPPDPKVDCIICRDSVRQSLAIQFPCQHHYDKDCFLQLFTEAMKDESLLPLRCCQREMPIATIALFLSSEDLSEYNKKLQEHQTVNRLYCPNPRCSTFMGPTSDMVSVKTCEKCYTMVCQKCKAEFTSTPHICSSSEDDESFLEVAASEQWQRCSRCHRMVELDTGCYHMTCICKHQFCYVCGVQWKGCTCPQWDEDRLLQRAREQVQVQLGMNPEHIPPPQVAAPAFHVPLQQQRYNDLFENQVQRAREALRSNHDCGHVRWSIRHGAGQCQSCYHHLKRYLLRCQGCQMLACVRCQRNRL